jgi:hypothetical protein
LNNVLVRCEISRSLRKRKGEYLKEKINELETNSKNKYVRDLYRGIKEVKKGYHPETNTVKDVNGDLFVGFHNISNRKKNNFCHLWNTHDVNDVRQT